MAKNFKNKLKFFNHPEGYVEPDGQGNFDYIYQYKDHLGNIRLSYRENGAESVDINEDFTSGTYDWTSDGVNVIINNTNQAFNITIKNKWQSTSKYIDVVPGVPVRIYFDFENVNMGSSVFFVRERIGGVWEPGEDRDVLFLSGNGQKFLEMVPTGDHLRLYFEKGTAADDGTLTSIKVDNFTVVQNVLEIVEENNYYPFGLKHKGYNNVVNGVDHPYGYNGKEEQGELGLNWLDFSARNYDASLGRWMNLDPFAHNYMKHSPYNYTLNNPVNNLDINGNFVLPKHFIEAYPRLAKYLQKGIQEIANNSRVMSALRKNGSFTDEEIKHHLTWGEGADIQIAQLGYGPRGIRPINGKYYKGEDTTILGKKSTSLLIDIDLVDALEKATGRDRDYYLFIVAATILHELTHYGDDRAENPTPFGYEEGNHFELDAYGKSVKDIDEVRDLVDKFIAEQDKKQEENEKKAEGLNNLINNFGSLEQGTYKWNGESWVKSK